MNIFLVDCEVSLFLAGASRLRNKFEPDGHKQGGSGIKFELGVCEKRMQF